MQGIFLGGANLQSNQELMQQKLLASQQEIPKFKRQFDFMPYVEPTITNFLEKEIQKLKQESSNLVLNGNLRSIKLSR